MEDCEVCGDPNMGYCNECDVVLCPKHDFPENHLNDCLVKKIEEFLYVKINYP